MNIRITAVCKSEYTDLMKKYENPIEHTCDITVGQQWISKDGKYPEGMCPSAWTSMREFVESLARGEGNFYNGWMKDPMSAMISCNDGFRPMSFYIEALPNSISASGKTRETTNAEEHPTQIHKKRFYELTLDELYELLRLRSEVFCVEQNCVYQDLDGDDKESIHVWITVGEKVVAMSRVCPAGTHMKEISIGRVISDFSCRGKGYGKEVMLHSIEAAKEYFGATHIDIEAQEYAKGFYENLGFVQSSETFDLDGIPHIKMTWKI